MRGVLAAIAVALDALALGVGVAACSGSSSDELAAGSGNDPGTGTGTLQLEGSVHATPRRTLARVSTDFDADFSLRLSRDNQAVTSGTVTVISATGKTPLTYRNDRWTGTLPIYDEVYVLEVTSGPDALEGLRIDGPDIHVFTQPTAGATVDTSRPLVIQWSGHDRADSAALRAENSPAIAIPDTGSYSLAVGVIRTDKSEARQHILRLSRTNRVAPAGAAIGSTWSVTIDNEINVITEPQPLPL